jgi:hypothetical protein
LENIKANPKIINIIVVNFTQLLALDFEDLFKIVDEGK